MNIYHSRYKLYKTYYLNKKSLGIEARVCNILGKMNEHPKFDMLKKCEVLIDENDISGYIKMTDNIIDKV